MLGNHVSALPDQHLGRIRFFPRIKPGIDPNDFHLKVRVDGLGTQNERVDAHHHFRNGKRGHIARNTGFGHLGRDLANDVTSFIKPRIVGGNVLGPFVTRGMFEFHIGEALCYFQGGIHKTKGRGKYQTSTLACQPGNGPFGVGTFSNLFHEHSFNFVAQLFLDG